MSTIQFATIAWQILCCLIVQDPLTVAPRAYKLHYENDWVRIVRVHYEPHERIASHDHPETGTAYVYLHDSGPVRFKHTGEEKFTIDRPAVKAGGFRLGRAVNETQETERLANEPTDLLRVELKTIPIDATSFRGRFPPDEHPIDRSSQTVRFENGQVRISQITCAAQNSCEAPNDTATPSLLIALTPAQFNIYRTSMLMSELRAELGETVWVESGTQLRFENIGKTAVELLRIDLKTRPEKGKEEKTTTN